MNRKHVAGATVVVWLLALGWLIQRNYWRPVSAVLAETTLRVPPGATYFAIHAGSQQIGFGASQLDTLRDTIRVQDVTVLQVPTAGRFERVEARTTMNLTRTLGLQGFETTVRHARGRFAARGTRSGDSALTIEIETMDGRRTTVTAMPTALVLPALLPLHIAFVDPATLGKRYSLQLLDPVSFTIRDLELTVSAESTIVFPDSAVLDSATSLWQPARWDTARTWRLTERGEGQDRHLWVDELGQIVHEEADVGYTAARTAFELAFENFQKTHRAEQPVGNVESEIVYATAIATGVPLPREPRTDFRIRIRGGSSSTPGISHSEGQLLDTLLLMALPAPGSGARQEALARFTQPTLLIESDDPRLQAQARQIVGRERRPKRKVELLTEWVFESVEKRPTVGPPNAVNVLATRQGDSGEHTILFVALARSLGFPARTVSGLLYIDGRFYPHSWPEVYIDEWVAVDPTLGQAQADSRHVRLTSGGPMSHLEFIKSIGALRFDVIPSNTRS